MEAVPYIRLSTEDQSSYSIDNQLREITAYCQKYNLTQTSPFIDNGESSYTFDRADFKRLELYIKKNRPQYIIVYHLDRFSRNLAEALQKTRELMSKYNVRVRDISEPLDIDDADPNVFMVRSFRFMMAENELHRIRQRIKSGMLQGALNGRHLNMAPYGYTNSRDDQNKPLLTINEEKALHVQVIFKEYIAGNTIEQVRHIAARIGYKQKGNSSVQRILSNPVYIGKIQVPGRNQLVQGIHQPIINEFDFYKAQQLLTGRKNIVHHANEEVFLRGVLKDHSGNLLTAGNSRGRSGRHYWYYVSKQNRQNFPAQKLHSQFYDLLGHLQFSPREQQWITEKIHQNISDKTATQKTVSVKLNEKLAGIKKRIEQTEEKYLLQPDISAATYKKVISNLRHEYNQVQADIVNNSTSAPAMMEKMNRLLPLLSNIRDLFRKLPLNNQHNFIRAMFDNSLAYYNECYRTPFIHPAFASKAALLKENRLLIIEQPVVKLGEIPIRTPPGNIIEQFDILLSSLVA